MSENGLKLNPTETLQCIRQFWFDWHLKTAEMNVVFHTLTESRALHCVFVITREISPLHKLLHVNKSLHWFEKQRALEDILRSGCCYWWIKGRIYMKWKWQSDAANILNNSGICRPSVFVYLYLHVLFVSKQLVFSWGNLHPEIKGVCLWRWYPDIIQLTLITNSSHNYWWLQCNITVLLIYISVIHTLTGQQDRVGHLHHLHHQHHAST